MFKVGDKIVCVDDSIILRMDGSFRHSYLTKGKVYVLRSVLTENEKIANLYVDSDIELRVGYSPKRFVTFVEYRKLKLNKICLRLEKE
jgi:hypothetical protein